MKTKRIKAFRLTPGDTVDMGMGMQDTVKEIRPIGDTTLKIYYEKGSLGLYGRQNYVNVITP